MCKVIDYQSLTISEKMRTDSWGWLELSNTHAYNIASKYVYYNPIIKAFSPLNHPSSCTSELSFWLGAKIEEL